MLKVVLGVFGGSWGVCVVRLDKSVFELAACGVKGLSFSGFRAWA